jgi:heme/copper-type cytochrome/quinol oxidase subunit 1
LRCGCADGSANTGSSDQHRTDAHWRCASGREVGEETEWEPNASSTEQATGQINAIESSRGIAAEWQGGQPLLWQRLFWMWGHPWVYTIVLPAQGIVSDAILSFCRRPLVGYTAVALSTVATMMLGFGVWVHHVIATGLPTIGLSIFSASTIVMSLPSAVQVFAWIATIWLGRPVFTTAFLFIAGFIVMFVIGGVSGVMTGVVPADLQLTDRGRGL